MVKVNSKSETGRSMVEMLGVLSIIGVLSVGGISAYTTAMEKHKANELLHQASMLATTISAQAMTNNGTLPSTITSFGNSNYGTFSPSTTDALDGKGFTITISNMDSAVCTRMEKMAGGMVQGASCSGTTLTLSYYKNLATNDEEGKKSPMGGSADGAEGEGGETGMLDPACADVTCEDGLTCFHGECKCPNGLLVCGEQCCAEGTYCTGSDDGSGSYTCTEPTSGCTKNSDCKDAEGNVDTTKYCKFSPRACTNLRTGTCTDKGELDDTNDFTVKTLNLPGGALTVYRSSGSMDWWSASNLCQAHGKQMVTMSDLGLADSGTNTDCYFDKTQSNYASYPCICNGGSDSDCSDTNMAIRGAFGTSDNLWLADNSKLNSCQVRTVYLFNGLVSSTAYRYFSSYVLCR